MGIRLLASEFICCAALGRWGTSATGGWGELLLCSTVSALCAWIWQPDPLWSLGTSPALCCHVCPWSRSRYHHLPPVLRVCCLPLLLGQGHHPRGTAVKAEPFRLHSLLIFLSFWLCFRSKILFAGHHLVSLAPGQRACLRSRALTKVRSSSDPQPSCTNQGGVGRGCPEGLPWCPGLSWVRYFIHVKYGTDFPSISLFDLPKCSLGDYIFIARSLSTSSP